MLRRAITLRTCQPTTCRFTVAASELPGHDTAMGGTIDIRSGGVTPRDAAFGRRSNVLATRTRSDPFGLGRRRPIEFTQTTCRSAARRRTRCWVELG